MKKLSVFVVGLAAVGTLAACDVDLGDRQQVENAYEVPGTLARLDLVNSSGSVTLTTGDGPVTVRERIRYKTDKPTTSHVVTGDTLKLTNAGCETRCSVEYTIRVPAAFAATVKIDSGKITASGLTGEVKLGTQSGSIDVRELTGNVELSTESGSVDGAALTGKTARVRTESGSIDLAFSAVPDSVDAHASSGDVMIAVPSGSYAVEHSTDSGSQDITVTQDAASTHKIKATTSSGSVEIRTK